MLRRFFVVTSQSLRMRNGFRQDKIGMGGGGFALAFVTTLVTTTITIMREKENDIVRSDDDDDSIRKKKNVDADKKKVVPSFNLVNEWVDDIQKDASQWFQNVILTSKNEEQQEEQTNSRNNDDSSNSNSNSSSNSNSWKAMKDNMTWLLRGEISPDEMKGILENATEYASKKSDATTGRQSFIEIQSMLMQHFQDISNVLSNNFSSIKNAMEEFYLDPTAMYYFLEEQDSIKNPSWKRRLHRYHPYVQVDDLKTFNTALSLAELSYDDSVDTIRQTLQEKHDCQLVFCDLTSMPGKASHFVALKQQQSYWSDTLEVLVVVRGTKSVTDMMTDALLEAQPYQGGLAHAGILKGGKHLANQHLSLFQHLKEYSKKQKIHVSFIGHSLGAGVATIAAMELNDSNNNNNTNNNNNNNITASVTGFGCPSLLSKELSEQVQPFVTTIIADCDVIPRMSAATIANLVMDIMEYDWREKGERDIQQALEELLYFQPPYVEKTMTFVKNRLDSFVQTKPPTTERMEPVLFPPGRCVHFYRDGFSISGTYSPCTFFNSIDVSRTMLHDHLISSGYRRIFLDIMRDHLDDAHFSFEPLSPPSPKTK